MSVLTSYLTILFADISGSTALFERLGDKAARLIVAESLNTLAKITERFAGHVVKTIGDEIMVTFTNPDNAILAAEDMQQELDNMIFQQINHSLSVRIGIHYGSVLVEDNDIFGDAVNVAARIVSLSKARQILITSQMLSALSISDNAAFRLIERTRVRGKQDVLDVYEHLWEQDKSDITVVARQPAMATQVADDCLTLIYQGNTILVNSAHAIAQIGRDVQSDIRIKGGLASRLHARIEYHKHKFILIDQSTNGTFVVNNNKDTRIHRDSVELVGNGCIGCGEAIDDQHVEAIHFCVNAIT